MRGDVCDRRDWVLALRDVASVVHLAAETGTGQSMYRIGDYTSTNVLGTALLLDVLANDRHGVNKIGAGLVPLGVWGRRLPVRSLRPGLSSHAQSGKPAGKSLGAPIVLVVAAPFDPVATPETARTSPASVYAATKLAQEDLVRIAANALGIPFLIFRLQNVYGEGQSLNNPYTGILSIFSNRIRQGKEIVLFEDGQESRDFVHVSDVAEAMALGLTSDGGDGLTMNVGSGMQVSVETIARSLKRQFKDPTRLSGRLRPVSIGRYSSQLCRYFGHRAAVGVFAKSAPRGGHRPLCSLGEDATHCPKRRRRRFGPRQSGVDRTRPDEGLSRC